MGTKERYHWVDAAKGISIILVVMMYSAHNVGKYTGDIGVLHYIIGFATPFRMPEFFLISGLFLSQVIARDWKRYADRRVMHYFYFYAIWVTIDIVLKLGVAGQDIPGMVRGLAGAVVQPYGVWWFIYMLGVFSLAAKLAWQFKLPHWLVLGAAALLQMVPIDVPSYAVTQFCAYFVFFYLGYAASPLVFRIVEAAAARPIPAVLGLVVWAIAETFLVFWPENVMLPMDMKMGYSAFPPLHLALADHSAACQLHAVRHRSRVARHRYRMPGRSRSSDPHRSPWRYRSDRTVLAHACGRGRADRPVPVPHVPANGGVPGLRGSGRGRRSPGRSPTRSPHHPCLYQMRHPWPDRSKARPRAPPSMAAAGRSRCPVTLHSSG